MTQPKSTKEKIEEIIKSWEFAVCPTETQEPFFWKWSEHGLEMLTAYITSLAEEEYGRGAKDKAEILEALTLMYEQYCEDGHLFMTAGETAQEVLEKYGLIKTHEDGTIITPKVAPSGSDERKEALENELSDEI